MATVEQHIQQSAMDKHLLAEHLSQYNRSHPDSLGFKYLDDFVIVPNDQSLSLWILKDVFGRDFGRFTSIKLAKEFADRRIITMKKLEERKQIEREEQERTDFNTGNT
jgi:hypothetical protein